MTLQPAFRPNGYIILKNQPDHPGKFVVRLKRNIGDETVLEPVPVAVADSIEAARDAISGADCLLRFPPGPGDDAGAVETWM
ncbi:hypothetical protein HY522_08650 [bacterium]|nr:hypothetical protein [bacterium]